MEKSTIKLLQVGVLQDGTKRFQTQLHESCTNFIMGKDGVMMHYDYKQPGGYGFYPFTGRYKIVKNKKDLHIQPL